MAELKLTRDDRAFLRTLHIDHGMGKVQDVADTIVGGIQPVPGSPEGMGVLVNGTTARAIIKEFGELTFDTYRAYCTKHRL